MAKDISERKRLAEDLGFQAHLLASIQEAVIANDVDGKILYWNRAAEHLFGWTRDEAVGESVTRLLGAEQTLEVSLNDEDTRTRQPAGDYRIRRKDGSHTIVRMVTSPLLDGTGRLQGFLAICEDVGREREVQRRYRDLVQHAPDGVLRTTPDGALDFANPAAATILGYDSVGQLLAEVEHVTDLYADPHGRQALMDQVRLPRPASVTTRFRRRDGSEIPVEIRARLHADPDGVEHLEGSFHDLTDRLQAEEAEKARLENEHLKELNQMRMDFLNTASHDLRTPLTPLKLQLATLRMKGGLDERQKAALDLMDRNVNRFQALVDDMLDAARLQAGKLKLERESVALAPLVQEAVASFHGAVRAAGLKVEVADLPDVRIDADPGKCMQVLMNLVSNAIKYTSRGGHIALRIGVDGNEAGLAVQDDGLGMTPEQVGRLFQSFVRLHEGIPGVAKGTGLGLYISKGIVESHGGRLWAESAGPGNGSTFYVAWPLAKTTPPAALRL